MRIFNLGRRRPKAAPALAVRTEEPEPRRPASVEADVSAEPSSPRPTLAVEQCSVPQARFSPEPSRADSLPPLRSKTPPGVSLPRAETAKEARLRLQAERPRGGRRAWTEKEVITLCLLSGKIADADIAEVLGRTPSAVQTKRHDLGLCAPGRGPRGGRRPKAKPKAPHPATVEAGATGPAPARGVRRTWTREEDRFVRENYGDGGMTCAEVAAALGRTKSSVSSYIEKCSLGRPNARRRAHPELEADLIARAEADPGSRPSLQSLAAKHGVNLARVETANNRLELTERKRLPSTSTEVAAWTDEEDALLVLVCTAPGRSFKCAVDKHLPHRPYRGATSRRRYLLARSGRYNLNELVSLWRDKIITGEVVVSEDVAEKIKRASS